MSKVTRLPRQIELTASHIDSLCAIAADLEQRADALRHHAHQIRRHAAALQAAADRASKKRKDYKAAEPIR